MRYLLPVCMAVLALAVSLPLFMNAEYHKTQIDVPDDFAAPETALSNLRAEFFKTSDWDGQVRVTVMIGKITNSKKKYDVLSEIASWDVRGTVGSTNTSIHARVIAISNLGESLSFRYADALLNILGTDRILDTRIEAALSLAKIGKVCKKDEQDLIVGRIIELLNDPQKYNFENFVRSDRQSKFYEDDQVAEAMAWALGEIGNPKAFNALLNIVNRKNHRDETINAAWLAMKKLKWN